MKEQLNAHVKVQKEQNEQVSHYSADVELVLESGAKAKIEYQKATLKDFNINNWAKAGVAIINDGVRSYSSTEDLSSESILKTFALALSNLDFIKKNRQASSYLQFYPQQNGIAQFADFYFAEEISLQDKKQLAFQIEDLALKADSRIQAVVYSGFIDNKYQMRILNSLGMDQYYRQNAYGVYVAPLAKDNDGHSKMDMNMASVRRFRDIDVAKLTSLAAAKAVGRLGAQSLPSGQYPIVIGKDVTPIFLQMISHCFSAIQVDRNTSLFKDQLHQQIAVSQLNIVDDPFVERGQNSRPFDAEGMPSQKHTLVANGVLKKFITNKEYAAKMGIEHTAHASCRGNGEMDIEPTNLFIEKGSFALPQLLQRHNQLIYITKFVGSFHGGYKESTGDFSLPCEGFWVEEGEIKRPVDQIVVSGNILEVLKKIEALGDCYGELNPTLWGPDLMISSLSVAGK